MAILTTNKFKLDNLSSLTGLTSSDAILVERYDTSKMDHVHFNVKQDYLARSVVSCLHFSSGKGVGNLSAIDYLSVQYVNGGFSSLLTCVPTSRGILSAAEYSDETHILSLLFNALDSEYGVITVDLGSLVDVYGGDANSESGLSSIYLSSNGNFFELFNFHEDGYTADDLSSIIEDNHLSTYDVLLKHKNSNSKHILEYMPLSSILYNGEIGSIQFDDQATQSQKSLEWKTQGTILYAQLYNMDDDGTSLPKKTITMSADGYTPLLPNDYEFVLRQNGAGGQITYANLSCCIPNLSGLSGTSISGDANILPDYKSIETKNYSDVDHYHQLYRFDENSVSAFNPVSDKNKFEFVVRYHNPTSPNTTDEIAYATLSGMTAISGDANVIPNESKSIATGTDQNGNTWHQLYGLGNTGVISATLAYDGDDHYIMNAGSTQSNDRKQFLYYDLDDKCLKYADICLTMPKVTASDLDDDVIPEISSVVVPEISGLLSDALSAELSALDGKYWIQGGDESTNYGSAIGNNGDIVIDLNNRWFYNTSRVAINLNDYELNCGQNDYWKTPNLSASGNINADTKVAAPLIHATGTNATLKIGNTTLNESQLQQLLALLNT